MADELLLDRGSAVPLYYQLQELLRQQIESGVWGPGDPLPSEPALCRRHALSRGCVRQALAILEADRAIVRRRGQGTFVAPTRLVSGVPGLVRVFARPDGVSPEVHVLDRRDGVAEESVCRVLGRPASGIVRLTTRWALGGVSYAIGVTFLDRAAVPWLVDAAVAGRPIALGAAAPAGGDPPVVGPSHGSVERPVLGSSEGALEQPVLGSSEGALEQPVLGSSEVSIETTECGRYEADQLGVGERSTLMVTVSVHSTLVDGVERPIEVTRLGYVGDRVQLRFRGEPVRDARPATWDFAP